MHKNAKDHCPREDAVCGVGDASGPKCGHGGNGTCIGSMLPNIYTCVCKPGYRGDDCNTGTVYIGLIWSAKNFALQPCWRVFVLLKIHAFKHSNYIFITICIYI